MGRRPSRPKLSVREYPATQLPSYRLLPRRGRRDSLLSLVFGTFRRLFYQLLQQLVGVAASRLGGTEAPGPLQRHGNRRRGEGEGSSRG